jgi:type VI secretion system protein ImpJ
VESLSFSPWGFCELRIDREALASGSFVVEAASGIFPDGLLFDIPEADAAPAAKPLADQFSPTDPALDVYLAVPQYRERGINVSVPGGTADTRYVSEVAVVRDEVRGAADRPVQVGRKGFRLLLETESRQGYSAMRIARVNRTAAGTYHLEENFVPPLLEIAGNDYLMTLARRLLEILTAKSGELAALRREKNQSLADFTSSEIASFWLLYTVNSHYPLLRHIFEVSRDHPERLFALMLSLAGALTTFSTDIHPRDLPVYDHDNLADCFGNLDSKLRILLEAVVPKHYVALAMQQVQPSIYATSLAEDRLFENTRYFLAINADMDQGQLIARAPQLVKVGSANQIDNLVRHALPGLELRHVLRPPAALPVKRHHAYFALNQVGGVWESIVRSRNVAAYVPGEFPGAELEMIVLLPKAQ